jgi:hypothetical protein
LIAKSPVHFFEIAVYPSGKNQNTLPELETEPSLGKFSVLHGREKILEPSERMAVQRSIKFIKKYYWNSSTETFIANALQSRSQALEPGELAHVEGQRFLRKSGRISRNTLSNFSNAKGFASTWWTEYSNIQWFRGLCLAVVRKSLMNCQIILYFASINQTQAADFNYGDIVFRFTSFAEPSNRWSRNGSSPVSTTWLFKALISEIYSLVF